MSARPLNYTTKISARITAGECVQILADAGAEAVALQYHEGAPVGLIFTIATPGGRADFVMPVDVAAMRKVLRAADFESLHTSSARLADLRSERHAANVAWRVVKDWLEANVALIAAQMVTLDGVMLPYLQLKSGGTLLDEYRQYGVKELVR
jgi:hypothetical protein